MTEQLLLGKPQIYRVVDFELSGIPMIDRRAATGCIPLP
jgi:hypothetical protein